MKRKTNQPEKKDTYEERKVTADFHRSDLSNECGATSLSH